jgi:hypothetical protein
MDHRPNRLPAPSLGLLETPNWRILPKELEEEGTNAAN